MCTQPGLAIGCFDGRPAAPVEAVGKESERGAKQFGGGRPDGHGTCVTGSHTARSVS